MCGLTFYKNRQLKIWILGIQWEKYVCLHWLQMKCLKHLPIDSIGRQSHPRSLQCSSTWIRWRSAVRECSQPNLWSSNRLRLCRRMPFPMPKQIAPIPVCHPIWHGELDLGSMHRSMQLDWLTLACLFDVGWKCVSKKSKLCDWWNFRFTLNNDDFYTDNVWLQFRAPLHFQSFCHQDKRALMSSNRANQILEQQCRIEHRHRSFCTPKWTSLKTSSIGQPCRQSNDAHTKYSASRIPFRISYWAIVTRLVAIYDTIVQKPI